MPFIVNNLDIDSWLGLSHKPFTLLDDSEYKFLLKEWRRAFDIQLEKDQFVCKGEKAMLTMESLLPAEVYIFNFPGFKKLPAPTNSKDKAYAYHVQNLLKVERVLLNKSDSIVSDMNFQYTCIYTHEWQGMAVPKFYEN